MDDLEAELERARTLDVDVLAEAIRSIGFSCTRCGACCRGQGEDHTATVFPDEVRGIVTGVNLSAGAAGEAVEAYDWRDVARPMPFGLEAGTDDSVGGGGAPGGGGPSEHEESASDESASDESASGAGGTPSGETFEWALQTGACGDCTFYDDGPEDGPGACTVYRDRPLICETYPFSVELAGSEPMGDVVESEGPVRAHECEGLGREIDPEDARALARTLKERAVREVEEMIAVRDSYEPAHPGPGEVVVHDSEGAKKPDGSPYR